VKRKGADSDPEPGPTLHVVLLGGFGVAVGNEPPGSVGTPRLQMLLAYLLLHRDAPQLRQHLAFVFWPDSSEAQARSNLRNLLHRLKEVFPDAIRYFEVGSSGVRLKQAASISIDVAELEAAVARADVADHTGDRAAARKALEAAVTIYRGGLLPGQYDDWVVAERERLAGLFTRSLSRLVSLLEEERDYTQAIEHAERLLQQDRLSETVYCILMRLYALAGDHARALRVYATCVDALRQELGVDPARTTREAFEQLRRGAWVPDSQSSTEPAGIRLVGRQREWATLRGGFDASRPRVRLLLLKGEAGVGKTRFAEEVLDWRRRQGELTAHARCYLGVVVSYAPVTAWLRTLALNEALDGLADLWLTEVARILPEILVERPELKGPASIRESWQHQRMLEALSRALIASGRPVTLLVDDLQWCDEATLEWLAFFLRWPTTTKVMFCATVRIEELEALPTLARFLAALRREGLAQELELGPLDAAETGVLAAQVAGRVWDPAALEHLFHETEGNPLFVVEAVRAGEQEALPPTVQAVIAFRLDQLSPNARELADLAATIGRAFTFPVFARASVNDDEGLVSGLEELTQRRIVRDQGDGEYDFSHEKIRQVAYARLSSARRRLLHGRVAAALEALNPDVDSICAELAPHHERAGHLDRAVVLYQRAGEAARRMHANADAAAHFRRAIRLLDALFRTPGADAERVRAGVVLHESLGDILALIGDYDSALSAYGAACAFLPAAAFIERARLQRRSGNVRESHHDYAAALDLYDLAEEVLGVVPEDGDKVWWQEWIAIQLGRLQVYYWTANVALMDALSAQLGPIVERHASPLQRASYLQQLTAASYRRERYVPSDATVAIAREALRAVLEADPGDGEGHAHFMLGFTLLWRGQLGEAREYLTAARVLADRGGDVALRARAGVYLATLARLRGDLDGARQLAEDALSLASAAQMPEYAGAARAHLAWLALRAGDGVGAADQARAALEAWRGIPAHYPFLWLVLWPLLDLAIGRGDVDEAVEHARKMLDREQQRLPDILTDALDEARTAFHSGDIRRARACLLAARGHARRIGYL
jgi:DNA-binding SARP family transcriptional activator